MKKSALFRKLNKSTIFKAVLTGLIIVAVEIICGSLIFSSYTSHTYQEAYAEYDSYISNVAEGVVSTIGDGADYSSSEVQNQLKSLVGDSYVLFSEAGGGRIVGEGWALSGTLESYGIDQFETGLFEIDGTTYAFCSRSLGGVYRLGFVDDFTDRQAAIDGLVSNMVAYLVIAGVFIIAVFIFYVNWAGYRAFTPKHAYKFAVGKDGKIISYNKKFREDFGAITKMDVDFAKYSEGYNIISVNGVKGEKTLAFTVDKNDKKYVVRADEIKNSTGVVDASDSEGGEITSTGKAMASLSKAFDDFSHRGKRTLIGIIVITNLTQIGGLFGKQMALDVQKEVIRKAQEKFRYVYELDFGRMGIACPDGNKFNVLIAGMADNLAYLAQPIKMEDNLFVAELRSGFAEAGKRLSRTNDQT